jgi:ElaB/YqjD/DUF883 family membrane-anchored ribosome-binding protein
MENEELIRKQMEDTRSSITEKLETLENKVSSDIQGATGAVTGTVEAVKDTVETVKDSVAETVETVKESVAVTAETVKDAVQEGLHSVSRWLDISSHVRNYPLLSVGVSAATGFLLESLVNGDSGRSSSSAPTASVPPARTAYRDERSTSSSIFSFFAPHLSLIRQVALGALLNAVKEPILKAAPTQSEALTKLFDNLSQSLGVDESSRGGADDSQRQQTSPVSPMTEEPNSLNAFNRPRPGSPLGSNHGRG